MRLTPRVCEADVPEHWKGHSAAWLKGTNAAIDDSNDRVERVLGEAPAYLTREQARVWALSD